MRGYKEFFSSAAVKQNGRRTVSLGSITSHKWFHQLGDFTAKKH